MDTSIPVWKNGAIVQEPDHKAASGDPPEAPGPVQSEEWTIVEGTEQSGIEARFVKGKKHYRARAWLDDDRYPGERGPVYSKEYRACDEADTGRQDDWGVNPLRASESQRQRDISAAVARSHMNPQKQAAPSDMKKVLTDLEADLLYPYKQWQMAQQRHVERMSATASLRETIDTMLSDINEHGMSEEYKLFIEQLQTLLSAKGKD